MPVPDGYGLKRPLTAILTPSCCRNFERKEEAVSRFRRLSHTLWHCQYHVVWVPKYRFRILTGSVKEAAEAGVQAICGYAGCEVMELNVQPDHLDRHGSLKAYTALKARIFARMEKSDCGIVLDSDSKRVRAAANSRKW